jgi:hypothetical protein
VVSGPESLHVVADRLDDAHELVAHSTAGLAGLHRPVRPEVAAANSGVSHANEDVGRFDQARVGNILDANITGAIHDGGAHQLSP